MPSIRMPIDTHSRLPDVALPWRYVSGSDVVVDTATSAEADSVEAKARLFTADVRRITRW